MWIFGAVLYIFFALGLVDKARAEIEVSTCEELLSGMAKGGNSFTLQSDIKCTETLVVDSTMAISISGRGQSLIIGKDVQNSGIISRGTLHIADMTITPEVFGDTVRGVYNEGTLVVKGCNFKALNMGSSSEALAYGGAVSETTLYLKLRIETKITLACLCGPILRIEIKSTGVKQVSRKPTERNKSLLGSSRYIAI